MTEDIASRIADPEDLRVLVMLAAVLVVGVLAVAAAAQMLPRDADGGFGFRWARRP
ncbi:hypothetical protein ACMA5K_24305 [Bradyrhizobium diazoefficiens]|uniref:hypothetical protein n=1 Tax=Bradyrhizobium diazoefficiens TaxID=1355477 RepID=UPI0015B75854|nr:hypothetical protein [Bradyrhizobium diazoefficiens]QLD43865.1 hypothetical protein HUW42_24085 [Bradyrhizobium diazoefficiens]